jgi:hypothetical protein
MKIISVKKSLSDMDKLALVVEPKMNEGILSHINKLKMKDSRMQVLRFEDFDGVLVVKAAADGVALSPSDGLLNTLFQLLTAAEEEATREENEKKEAERNQQAVKEKNVNTAAKYFDVPVEP